MKIEDVQTWTTSRGIGCAVLSREGARGQWLLTPHGVTTGSTTKRRPSRICKRCRDLLPDLQPEPEVPRVP